jgi:hypothetical protein
VYFLAWFQGFEGYEHGPRTNTRWIISLRWLFENLNCSRKVSTSTVSTWLAGRGIVATRSSRFTARDQFDRDFQKIIMRKRRANKRVPISPVRRWLQVGTSKNNLAHTFTYFANFEVLTLVVSKVQHFSRLMQCVCFCSMVLMMHVRMTWLPTCVSDCKGNQVERGSVWRVAISQPRYLACS